MHAHSYQSEVRTIHKRSGRYQKYETLSVLGSNVVLSCSLFGAKPFQWATNLGWYKVAQLHGSQWHCCD